MRRNYKTYTGLKVYTTIVSIILAAAIVLTACAFGLHWVQITPDEEVEQVQEPEEDVEEDGGMIVEEGEESGISLMMTKLSADEYADYGISPLAESAYTLTATAYDANNLALDSYQYFSFSMAWSDSKDESVEDYVSMSTTDNTATFACLQAFDTQIIVTVTNTVDDSLSATATIDYYQRVTGTTVGGVSVTDDSGSAVVTNSYPGTSYGSSALLDYYFNYSGTVNYGTGSLANSVTKTVTVTLSDEFVSALEEIEPMFSTVLQTSFELENEGATPAYFFAPMLGGVGTTVLFGMMEYIQQAIASTSNQATVSVEITPTYGTAVTYSYTLNMTMMETTLSEIQLSDSSFLF